MDELEYQQITNEIAGSLAKDEGFKEFVKWCMINDESILNELDILLEQYITNRQWLEYYRTLEI